LVINHFSLHSNGYMKLNNEIKFGLSWIARNIECFQLGCRGVSTVFWNLNGKLHASLACKSSTCTRNLHNLFRSSRNFVPPSFLLPQRFTVPFPLRPPFDFHEPLSKPFARCMSNSAERKRYSIVYSMCYKIKNNILTKQTILR
jgi:hypothetical protein